MIILKKLNCTVLFLSLVTLVFSACKGPSENISGGDQDQTPLGLNNANSVTGKVRSAGADPMAGVTVYIPRTDTPAEQIRPSRSDEMELSAADGTRCQDPPASDNYLVAACTAADGTFDMDSTNIAGNPKKIIFQKGSLRLIQDLSCSADPCELALATTTFNQNAIWPQIAVVTGRYDRMEDILAKLADINTADTLKGGYGRVFSETGRFVYGSESRTSLTLIDGTGDLAPSDPDQSVSYDRWDSYFDGTNELVVDEAPVFEVIFINSGNAFEEEILEDPDKVALLEEYVNAGGRLFVTDTAYDFIEQTFPDVMWFEGENNNPNLPGRLNAAEFGNLRVNFDAVVADDDLSEWLQNVSVNTRGGDRPGNPDDDCSARADQYDQTTGALTLNGLIPVGNFLDDWAEMVDNHSGRVTKIWVSAGDDIIINFERDRPLTISRAIGSNGGMVFFSSYHTATACPSTTFWPQERILQYLIFEAF